MMKDKPISGILMVDALSRDKGHLVEDDLFLSECLNGLTDKFQLLTSPKSAKNVREILNIKADLLKPYTFMQNNARIQYLLKMFTIKPFGFSRVLFSCFEEVATLLFMVLHPFTKLSVIITNNISLDRFKRHPIMARLVLGIVFKRAYRIFLHCDFQINFIKEYFPSVDTKKLVKIPFHKIGFKRHIPTYSEREKSILFIGPVLPHKPLDPVIEIIKRDTEKKYKYVFCCMKEIRPDILSFLESQDNVEILRGYLSDDEYYNRISNSSLVIMTHDTDYEGRLSGVFCDAVACGTAIISMKIEPHIEFFKRFGDMGFFVDFSDQLFADFILKMDIEVLYPSFQKNMSSFREYCSLDSIRSAFESALK